MATKNTQQEHKCYDWHLYHKVFDSDLYIPNARWLLVHLKLAIELHYMCGYS